MLPFVSVIVPVFNGQDTIEACLNALVAQDYPADRYEVIIVDNNSTDGTTRLVQQFPVRYILERSRQSSYAARNRGVREAQGALLAFTDADCVPDPAWLRYGVAAFASATVGGVAGTIASLDPATVAQRYAVRKGALSQETALTQNSFRPAVYTANALYRKAALEQAGGFDPGVISGGDADLAWRVQELGFSITFAPQAVVRHRHRERVADLLRQRRNYGYGSVVNYVKHREAMGRRTLRHGYWELRAFLRKLGRLAGTAVRCAIRGFPVGEREEVALDAVDVLAFCAKKAGQLSAAARYRVWYF